MKGSDRLNTNKKESKKTLKHKRRFCRVVGCTRIIKSQGLCQGHGAKPRTCKIPGCTKQAQGTFRGMCKAHARQEQHDDPVKNQVNVYNTKVPLLPFPQCLPLGVAKHSKPRNASHPLLPANSMRRVSTNFPNEGTFPTPSSTTIKQTVVTPRSRFCKTTGCNRTIKSQGVCQRHGAVTVKCRVPKCCKQAQGGHHGMCKAHFQELQACSLPQQQEQHGKEKTEQTGASSLSVVAINEDASSPRSIHEIVNEYNFQRQQYPTDPYAPITSYSSGTTFCPPPPRMNSPPYTHVKRSQTSSPRRAAATAPRQRHSRAPLAPQLTPSSSSATMDDPDFREALHALITSETINTSDPPIDVMEPIAFNPDWFEATAV